MLTSRLCTEQTLLAPAMLAWAAQLKEVPGHLHRKIWEWCFISEALSERGMLAHGRRGLGFAVGQEPLAAAFASRGARITATDLCPADAEQGGWIATSQHASGFAAINARNLCDPDKFRELVSFQFADMNHIGPALHGDYDFLWSACALEHLGSLEHGLNFIRQAMDCLKPGGFAVHTTEFNVSSNTDTVEEGATVLYRQKDIEALVAGLRKQGHRVKMDWTQGSSAADQIIDVPPYKHDIHLKVAIGQYVVTSMALIIQKAPKSFCRRLFGQ